ncbi:hypothetical protein EJ03DRAFT_324549 [Teratosphaeria nubilosa]|uniref:Fungal calcium binding protein domain-containing protein n=1 Tax=Teratosphaeria nubilosa TaxID=161662 RepID=A0A6G1LHV9_9PEZI|nr:hypothetical protein EJ03DRAFT_324549 [Teratosphaeria nubilosa]
MKSIPLLLAAIVASVAPVPQNDTSALVDGFKENDVCGIWVIARIKCVFRMLRLLDVRAPGQHCNSFLAMIDAISAEVWLVEG